MLALVPECVAILLLLKFVSSTVIKVNIPEDAAVAPIVAPSIEPPSILAVSARKSSILAIPVINKFLHSSEELPKSLVALFGINDDANLAFAVMVSVLALPRVVLPLTDKLSVTVKSLPIVTSSGSPIRT